MHVQEISFDYSKQKEFSFLFCSDFHIGSKSHDRKLLISELDTAKEKNAKIMIAGDWGEFIMSGDKKRYSPSSDPYNSDSYINNLEDEAFEVLRPYADNIIFIGCGNHETSVTKFHNYDPTQSLIKMLNRECKTSIKHGQYSGFVRLKYLHGKQGAVKSKVIYYNHGQGGTAEISKGAIDLNRHFTSKNCDIVWLGHKHTKLVLPCETEIGIDKSNKIIQRKKIGIITGAYVKPVEQYDAMDTGYKLNYGEERMRTLQSTGGIFLTHVLTSNDIKQIIMTEH